MAKSEWLCCFCGKEIEKKGPDPCMLGVTTAREKGQAWACHANCFKERLAKEHIFEPAFF